MDFTLILLGYLSGSVPFGLLITRRVAERDIRKEGSGNIGATNVARVAGKQWGLVVLALDAMKGAIPVVVALWLRPGAAWLHAGVGLAAVVGHVLPVWLRFKGGKGVATALGVLGVLAPEAALTGAAAYVVLLALLRVSSIGSLGGGAAALLAVWCSERPKEYFWVASAIFLVLVVTHRGNVRRIVRRVERKL